MRRTKTNPKNNPDRYDPYEESLRLGKMDAYESLIQIKFISEKDEFLE